MPYLIDSDVIIDHLADVPTATKLLEHLAKKGIAVSIITYMEAYQGVLRSPHQTRARKQFEAFLETVPVLPFSLAGAKRYAQVRETLYREGKRVKARALDLMTTTIALEYGLTVEARNVADYTDIRGLKLYKAS